MKSLSALRVALAVAFLQIGVVQVELPAAPDITGRWWADIPNKTPVPGQHYTFEFKVDGSTLTGTVDSEGGRRAIEEGHVAGETISFVELVVFDSDLIRIEYSGVVSGDEIRFTRTVEDYESEQFIARRSVTL